MKVGAFILLVLFGVLTVQPIFSTANTEAIESSCCKSKCNKPQPAEGDDDCANNRCNPLMACPVGNFYLAVHSQITITTFIPLKQKMRLVDDNRLATKSTDYWHPPEII